MRPTHVRCSAPIPLAALALAALAAACARKPSAVTCSTHADCPSGTTCQHGVCQEGLVLELTAPAGAVTYTKGGVPCQVTVTGTTPGAVQLAVDGVPVQTLVAPFSGDLDTSGLTEASHTLVAVAETGGRTFVSAPRTIVVDRTAPAAPAVRSATTTHPDPVTVGGTWATNDTGAPVTITVYEGATVLKSGIVPSAGAWSDSFDLAEGAHALTARAFDGAGNQSSLSAAGIITVDRTAPSVTGHDPATDATNVWSRDHVVVTFSEPVRPGTIDATNVRVSSASPAFDVAFTSMTLSPDGMTLTLVPDTTSLPPVPSDVTMTLSSGILDLAGNPLPTTTWSWSYPDWVDAAPPFTGGYYIAQHAWSASPAGVLYDATADRMGTRVNSSTAGGAWADLGQLSQRNLNQAGIGVDSQGRPVVATREDGGIVVRRYSGSWDPLGAISTSIPSRPLVGIDSQDRPIVLWKDGSDVVAGYRWNGVDWSEQVVPGRTSSATGAYALVVKDGDTAASAYVLSDGQIGASDVVTPASVGDVAGLAVAQGYAGDDFIAYVTTTGTAGVLTVLRGYPASRLTAFGPTLPAYASLYAWAPGIAYRSVGPTTSRLFLSFKAGNGRPMVYAWDGSSQWASITGTLALSAGAAVRDVELFVTSSGQLYLGWWEVYHTDFWALFVKRYNR